jgi:hypothetical protein
MKSPVKHFRALANTLNGLHTGDPMVRKSARKSSNRSPQTRIAFTGFDSISPQHVKVRMQILNSLMVDDTIGLERLSSLLNLQLSNKASAE